ncbi:MAG: acyltransferase family protein [Parasporobacterium sp.]|nr:acyltransferase family protein [Parasporobacterium sp.]
MSSRMVTDNQRIAWVDILRFLGMTLIYWGHLGVSDNITLYIFAHHVPLFFFISGFFAGLSPAEGSFFRFLWKKIRSLVFPYIFFTILYYAVQLIMGEMVFRDLPKALLVSAEGIRNQAPGPLWFFTCLFVIVIAFELIKRICSAIFGRGKAGGVLAFLLAVVLFVVGICFLGHEPAQDPRWIWNVDSACVYIFYYALGALLFPLINRWKYNRRSGAGKFFFFLCFGLSVLFAVFTCFRGAAFTETVRSFLSKLLPGNIFGGALFEIYALVSALILIFMELCIARIISLIPAIGRFLAYVGKDSLYHCGNELIIKYFGRIALFTLGLNVVFQNDLLLLLYSIVCLIVLTFTLNLLERLVLGPLFGTGRFRK